MPYQQPTARPLLTFIIAIVLDIPLLAVTARRLHDVGRSGWWMLCPILPILSFGKPTSYKGIKM
ncbi:MAG: DUF805 domain-containing protein [Prevotella sp.]|nr:DUF805 domain-containing protein [Prevotella sp.]